MITIFDGYVDEPACLGVPPYISPYPRYPRYIAGALREAKHDFVYITIDDYRNKSPKIKLLEKSNLLVVIAGAVVPGKYLRAMPASFKELRELARNFKGLKIIGGAAARFFPAKFKEFDFTVKKDLDASVCDFLTTGEFLDRTRTHAEWERWVLKGTQIVRQHPDFPLPLIAEIETYRGCVRYFTGGCSFCIEPLFGKPKFRSVKNIVKEVELLSEIGVVNFRLGAQSCFFSYQAKGIGKTETPKPNAEAIKKLLVGIRASKLKVLHLDNANPAVIAEHPIESKKIANLIVEYCTPGNVAALGMESADPEVIKKNNLNATPEQVMKAIELLNEVGSERGSNGMPNFLPGLNFVFGLKGESKQSYRLAYEFLKKVLDKGLLLRRINLRQVLPVRTKFDTRRYHSEFVKCKEKIREEIDKELVKKVVPYGTVLKEVFTEKILGNYTYARQIGAYPLLVILPYKIEENKFINCSVIDHSARSVTGIEFPLRINKASLKALEALPGIGKKRAMRILRARPFHTEEDFVTCLDDKQVAERVLRFLDFH